MRIDTVAPDEWRRWRALRLRALDTDPRAFATSAHAWLGDGDTETRWRERLTGPGACFVAVDETGEDIALAALDLVGDPELVSMWVAPSARRKGAGQALVRAVILAMPDPAATLSLRVMADNRAAVEFYASAGFVLSGKESDAEGTLTMGRDGSRAPSAWSRPATRPHRPGGPPPGRSADQ